MISKRFISPDELRRLSFRLAAQIESPPDFLVALWRGGAPIGLYLHEYLKRKFPTATIDHIPIYTEIGEASGSVQVDNLGYIFSHIKENQTILIVDDVWDAGTTMMAVLSKLEILKTTIKVAVMFYKPTKNKTLRTPNYYVQETDQWLVFPHELEELTDQEIEEHYGGIKVPVSKYSIKIYGIEEMTIWDKDGNLISL